MLVLIKASGIDAETRIGEISRDGGIRQIEVDDEGGEKSQRDAPAPCTAAHVGILRPDDAIMVLIPIVYMLDHDL